MSKHISPLILFLLTAVLTASAQTQPVTVTIDAGKKGAPISKCIYGQFIEHIGGIINNGIWAEMLDDRKFYNPITSEPQAASPSRGRRGMLRRWTPIGPAESVVMDTNRPFAGDHTPLVKLEGADARGIRQAGLAVRKNKAYTGRVVLTGDRGVKISVSLVWGTNANERQIVTVGRLDAAFKKFPLKFKAQADSDNAQLEIVGDRERLVSHRCGVAHAGGQRRGFSRGSNRRAEAVAVRCVSVSGRELRLGPRMARCDWRPRPARADV